MRPEICILLFLDLITFFEIFLNINSTFTYVTCEFFFIQSVFVDENETY